MDAVISCGYCKQKVRRKTGPGRQPSYCSTACRRAAEYLERRKSRSFEAYKAGFHELGEVETRKRVADDPGFAEQLIELAETYLAPPDGRSRVVPDDETLQMVTRKPRSFIMLAAGHDTPLPSSADIDQAEASGDWWPMVQAALKGMTWQLANGFVPDMREFF